jgi:cardiolipin synthase (CMP-forming)
MAPSPPLATGVRARFRALPNIISSSRVVLAAGFAAADGPDMRLGIVGVAAITDFLDGWVARRTHATSRWGALLDPIADRVFALVAVSTFLFIGTLSTVEYFVMISRDIMTAIGFLVAKTVSWLKPVEFKARVSGKVVTVMQFVAFIALLRFPEWATLCVWLVGAASVYSVVDYTIALWRRRAA